jgi:hypothetical protein
MTIAEIEGLWGLLAPTSANEFSGRRVPGFPPAAPVYAALDHSNRRHLLIEVPPDCPVIDMRSTHGLNVSTAELRVQSFAGATYIDLECLQQSYHRTFAALASDLLESLTRTQDRRKAVSNCLERWRSFWLVNQAGLSREAALGLFGELWFIARWLNPITETKLGGWHGPSGARHDFQWEEASIEVKTSATSPSVSPVHFVSNIDQLSDPEQGKLYLFSLHVTDDALASNDLPSIVQLITTMLAGDETSLARFSKKLADAGYSPAHAEYYKRPLRIIAEELYTVESEFPRLTRNSFRASLPDGVQEISYSLAIAACGQWRIATGPADDAACQVTQSLSSARFTT